MTHRQEAKNMMTRLAQLQARDDELHRLSRQRPLTDGEKKEWVELLHAETELELELEYMGVVR